MSQRSTSLSKIEEIDIGQLVVGTAKNVVKNRPVGVSMWAVGLLIAAFAKGFSVSPEKLDSYQMTLQHAEEVDAKEFNRAIKDYQRHEERYRSLKGWFSCDDACQKAKDKMDMAKGEVNRVQKKRDAIITEARQEVGIWSVFGVQDVRDSFWSAWKSGKDFAARYTMMDAMFMMMPGSREESAISMILKIVMQYVMNLTVGLVGAFFFFVYNVYSLVVAYGESFFSGLAFFLLVLVAGTATVGTYLVAIYGTVAGGGLYLVQQAAKNARLQDEQGRGPGQRRVQYGGPGGPGDFRQRRAY